MCVFGVRLTYSLTLRIALQTSRRILHLEQAR
jgi:hypothetical protein